MERIETFVAHRSCQDGTGYRSGFMISLLVLAKKPGVREDWLDFPSLGECWSFAANCRSLAVDLQASRIPYITTDPTIIAANNSTLKAWNLNFLASKITKNKLSELGVFEADSERASVLDVHRK